MMNKILSFRSFANRISEVEHPASNAEAPAPVKNDLRVFIITPISPFKVMKTIDASQKTIKL